MAVHLAVACDAFMDVSLCCPFSHEMSWIRYGAQLGRFLRVFLLTFLLHKALHHHHTRRPDITEILLKRT